MSCPRTFRSPAGQPPISGVQTCPQDGDWGGAAVPLRLPVTPAPHGPVPVRFASGPFRGLGPLSPDELGGRCVVGAAVWARRDLNPRPQRCEGEAVTHSDQALPNDDS
jgi:hypothetical protein